MPRILRTRCCVSRLARRSYAKNPFALNTAQVTQMVAQARQAEAFLMGAMWMRFIPLIAELQARINAGVIGEVRMIQADFGFRAPFDPRSRLFDPKLARVRCWILAFTRWRLRPCC